MANDHHMNPERQVNQEQRGQELEDTSEKAELVLFQTNECYVYMIPPRRSAASYRADEWNVNKWAWEGALRIVSRGDECFIKLEDKNTGELFAQSFVRRGQPLPVEPVIDSSRYFVLCIEENFGGRTRHAFIGIGFRERSHAYDFQAALYDHVKYLNKKEAAEEMEQMFQTKSSVDYSLKEGQTLRLQLKHPSKGSGKKSAFFEKNFDKLSISDPAEKTVGLPCLAPPPPPPPKASVSSPRASPKHPNTENTLPLSLTGKAQGPAEPSATSKDPKIEVSDSGDTTEERELGEEFGDFQTAN